MPTSQDHHQNPNYYAETASLYGEHGQHQQQQGPPPQYHEYMHQQYPPPPGPPPTGQGEYAPPKPPRPEQQQNQQQQSYYEPQPPPTAQGQGYPPPGQQPPAVAGGGDGAGSGDNQGYINSSKPTFKERLYQWSTKAGVPINKVTNRLGSEAFWPSTMDIECDKAARILKSFCSNVSPLFSFLFPSYP